MCISWAAVYAALFLLVSPLMPFESRYYWAPLTVSIRMTTLSNEKSKPLEKTGRKATGLNPILKDGTR